MTAIIYHSGCHDGMASAAVVNKAFNNEAYTIPYSYNGKFDLGRLRKDEEVIMVDISMPFEQMKYLNDNYDFTWIDHHVRDWDEDAKDFHPKGTRIIDTDRAGCILCWDYYYKDQPIPPALELISNFDLWKIEHPGVLEFDYACRSLDLRPIPKNQVFWDSVLSAGSIEKNLFVKNLLYTGEGIARYQEELSGSAQSEIMFETNFAGYSATVANTRGFSSLFFNGSEADTALLILYAWIAKIQAYRFSVYSNGRADINVAEILKPYHGGGRDGVGGFTSRMLPFPTGPATGNEDDPVSIGPADIELYERSDEITKISPAVRMHAYRNMTIAVQSTYGEVMFEGNLSIAANVLYTSVAAFYPVWNPMFKFAIAWVWTNRGNYRMIIHAFQNSEELDQLEEKYNGTRVGNSLWIYLPELPFPPG